MGAGGRIAAGFVKAAPADDLDVPPARYRALHAPRPNAQALQQATALLSGANRR